MNTPLFHFQKKIYRSEESSKVRRMRHIILLFAVLIILIGCGKEEGEGSKQLFNPNNAGHVKMEKKIRVRTKRKTGDFTKDDLIKVIALQLPDSQVDDLTPLASLGQLQILVLNNNQITDLKPLSKLTNLKTLNLANNKITDLTPLQTPGMEGLTSLNLSNNPGLTKTEIDRFMKAMSYLKFQKPMLEGGLIHNAK
jgi:hypothetical protein|tara:strand:+ start:1280 stop:1867 length:588 start_codon:yes stop_codon:yes gene_type:complete